MQPKLAARAQAGNGCPARIGSGQTRTLGVAGCGMALCLRQVGGKPVLALGKRLRVCVNGFDAIQIGLQAQQVVAHQQAGFTNDVQRRGQKQIERTCHYAFGGVFHRHYAKGSAARCHGLKHIVKAAARHMLNADAKKRFSGLLAKSASGPQIGNALRRFQRTAGRHDFAPDVGNVGVFEWAAVGRLHFLDDLRLALGAENLRAFFALDVAHFVSQSRALVECVQQLLVKCINGYAQVGNGSCHGAKFLEK